ALQDLRDRIEGARLLPVRLIACMKHERRGRPQPIHTVDDLLEGGGGVLVRLALEADVRVADLYEGEAPRGGVRGRRVCDQSRRQHATRSCPDDTCARPRHAFEKPPSIHPIHAVLLAISGVYFTTSAPFM